MKYIQRYITFLLLVVAPFTHSWNLSLVISDEEQLIVNAQLGNIDRVAQQLDDGADIHYMDKEKGTALHVAVRNNHAHVVNLLITRGADLFAREPNTGATALDLAREAQHITIIALLAQAEQSKL
jgi:ankyrin repeat protein